METLGAQYFHAHVRGPLSVAAGSWPVDSLQSHRAVNNQEGEVFLGLLPTAASLSRQHPEVMRARHPETTA